MKWTGINDLRERYLSFFEGKGHRRLASAPLVPIGDSSLLLINSGMAPLKKYFMGLEAPPSRRVTSCQKCIRTPDIERVGKTSRHGTYFEMLGNFSFGDYFKREACAWAWEFITEDLELPVDRLWVSIYLDDDEAFDIWTGEVGVSPERIVRLGREDNFWEIGTGPCGPCSEIYFDRGPDKGCGRESCAVGCDCDRYVEFWNLVFTQFDSDGAGNYTPLEHPNIDTGMGLERIGCIMQEVDNLFEVDTMQNIMKHISDIVGVRYRENERADTSLRVITDHIRSTTFLVGDGVLPSNEGRGYVLRRLLRRAARHGILLGCREPFLYKVCRTVVAENASAYPELADKADYIEKVIRVEEERFGKTIAEGLALFSERVEALGSGEKVFPGHEAFRLYDTFGFPIDLIAELLEERGMRVDLEGFQQLMREQRERARSARQGSADEGWKEELDPELLSADVTFTGYTSLTEETVLEAIIAGGEAVGEAPAGTEVMLVLRDTPFYAESGGQVADTGAVTARGVRVRIGGAKEIFGKNVALGTVTEGTIKAGDAVTAAVDESARRATERNHTSAHLLQAALREVLGDHIHQAGQLVDRDRVRFDFTHFSAMTAEELRRAEDLVNRAILEAAPVAAQEMPIAEAKKQGAMALFSEKYGDVVRVVRVPGVSAELCGGTHARNTGELGLFKILSESSVAAGVRRIEGVTGTGSLALLRELEDTVAGVGAALKVSRREELRGRAEALQDELRRSRQEIDKLKAAGQKGAVEAVRESAAAVGPVSLLRGELPGADADSLRRIADDLRAEDPARVVVLFGESNAVAACGPAAVTAGVRAGDVVKKLGEYTGGRGGGKPDFAMGGAGDGARRAEALRALPDILSELMG